MEQFTCANIFAGLHHPSSTGEKIKKTGNDKRQIFVYSLKINRPLTFLQHISILIFISLFRKKSIMLCNVFTQGDNEEDSHATIKTH